MEDAMDGVQGEMTKMLCILDRHGRRFFVHRGQFLGFPPWLNFSLANDFTTVL
jgi:hypothetical protein